MSLKKLIKISRPRFWIYELGPYIIGLAVVFNTESQLWLLPAVIIFFVFFTYPANLFIYGINDIYDYETDKNNPKKTTYEELVIPSEHAKLFWYIFLLTTPFVIYSLLYNSWITNLALASFFIFAGFYSAKPVRAKTKPLLDSFFSAGHYTATGVFSYLLAIELTNLTANWKALIIIVVAGLAWSMAMHAYSAVPDIKADSQAKLSTIATYLGFHQTLYLCIFLYGLSTLLIFFYLGPIIIALGFIYISLMVLSLLRPKQIFKHYTYFPIINTLNGMTIFLLTLFLS